MYRLCVTQKKKPFPLKERPDKKYSLAVTAVFLYKASAICTLLVGRVRLMCADNDFIEDTVTLLIVVMLAGKN